MDSVNAVGDRGSHACVGSGSLPCLQAWIRILRYLLTPSPSGRNVLAEESVLSRALSLSEAGSRLLDRDGGHLAFS